MLAGLMCPVFYLAPKPFVVLELKEWKGVQWSFVPQPGMKIIFTDPILKDVAEALAFPLGKAGNAITA